MTHDVLDLDDRIVDQNAGRERDREEAHEIEREAQNVHRPEGGEDRQRKRHRGDDGRADVAQEQEHHDHRQRGALEQRVDGRFVVAEGEVDHGVDLLDLDVGIALPDLVDFLLHRGGDDDVALALGAPDAERDDGFAVEPGEGARRRHGVGHDAEIFEPDLAAHRQADHHSGKLVEGLGSRQRPDRLVAAADFGEAAGEVDIGAAQPLADIGGGQADRLQPVGVERHQDFAVDAADALHLGDAAHPLQRPLHHVVDEP